MKKIFIFIFAIIFFLTTGCSSVTAESVNDKTAPQQFTQQDEKSGKALAEKYITALVQSIQKNDFNIIAPYLQVDMLSMRQKKSIFNEMCKRFALNGKIVSYSLLEVIDQTLCRDYIWKIDFEKQTSSAKLPTIRTSMLYTIRIVMGDKTPEIVRARPIQL